MYLRCDGELTVALDNSVSCTNWVTVTEEELLAATPILELFELLNAAFETPEPNQIVTAFMAAFTVPMIAYLVSWGYSKVINFIR